MRDVYTMYIGCSADSDCAAVRRSYTASVARFPLRWRDDTVSLQVQYSHWINAVHRFLGRRPGYGLYVISRCSDLGLLCTNAHMFIDEKGTECEKRRWISADAIYRENT